MHIYLLIIPSEQGNSGGRGVVTEPKQARWKARERVRIDGCSIHRPTTDDLVTELPVLVHERRKKEAPGKEKYNSRIEGTTLLLSKLTCQFTGS